MKANFIDEDIELDDEVLEIEAYKKLCYKVNDENRQEVECIENGPLKHEIGNGIHEQEVKILIWTIKLWNEKNTANKGTKLSLKPHEKKRKELSLRH